MIVVMIYEKDAFGAPWASGCLLGVSWVPPGCLMDAFWVLPGWVPPGLLDASWVPPRRFNRTVNASTHRSIDLLLRRFESYRKVEQAMHSYHT